MERCGAWKPCDVTETVPKWKACYPQAVILSFASGVKPACPACPEINSAGDRAWRKFWERTFTRICSKTCTSRFHPEKRYAIPRVWECQAKTGFRQFMRIIWSDTIGAT